MSDTQSSSAGTPMRQTHEEARKLRDEAWERSALVYKQAKEHADIVYEAAKKLAVDAEARKRADDAHEEALKEARRLREAITRVADCRLLRFLEHLASILDQRQIMLPDARRIAVYRKSSRPGVNDGSWHRGCHRELAHLHPSHT